MRSAGIAAGLVLSVALSQAGAQTLSSATPPPTTPEALLGLPSAPGGGGSNPIVASVDGKPIRLSDVGKALQTLPENLRNLPFDTVYLVLLDRLVDHQALVLAAKRAGLEDLPAVKLEIEAAVERILEGAYLGRTAVPKVTDEAVQDLYNRMYANKPGVDEVRARHILVETEAEARKIIEELRQGADFAAIARTVSRDPDGKNGGELGFFRRDQVWPAFADLAFALPPGQVANNPIRNEFGWHVVQVTEKRQVAPPSFAEVKDDLRKTLLAQAVGDSVKQARSQVIIRRFNLDGTELENSLGIRGMITPPNADLNSQPTPGR